MAAVDLAMLTAAFNNKTLAINTAGTGEGPGYWKRIIKRKIAPGVSIPDMANV